MTRTTIVVPCYNEADRLDASAFLAFSARERDVFFQFVDDGSTDGTPDALERLRAAHPDCFAVLRLQRNLGKGEAVRAGLLAALERGCELAGYWDADLATPLRAIPTFRAVLEERPATELVLGARVRLLGRRIRRHAVRHYLGRVFATGASLALRVPVYDTQCGAKLFRVNPRLRSILSEPFRSRWVFDVEIIARMLDGVPRDEREHHPRLYELPLSEWTDVGDSRVRARDFGRAAIDLLRVYLRYGSGRRQWLSSGAPGAPRPTSLRNECVKAPARAQVGPG
jgi:dolichyl-phosphate beta-glucosyltransferase